MTTIRAFRAYHATLGLLVLAAFFTGEAGLIHLVLGYSIAALLVGRAFAAFSGLRQLGLARFYPQFAGLNLGNLATHPAISKVLLAGIAVTLIGATASGIAVDRDDRRAPIAAALMAPALAGEHEHEHERAGAAAALEHLHEGVSNALITLVILHVLYLLAFKRPLARFMLFLETPKPAVATAPQATRP